MRLKRQVRDPISDSIPCFKNYTYDPSKNVTFSPQSFMIACLKSLVVNIWQEVGGGANMIGGWLEMV